MKKTTICLFAAIALALVLTPPVAMARGSLAVATITTINIYNSTVFLVCGAPMATFAKQNGSLYVISRAGFDAVITESAYTPDLRKNLYTLAVGRSRFTGHAALQRRI